MADLIYEVHNHLARITLNRPKQLNCFSEEMIRLWTEALEDVRDNDDVYALLLSGNGKAFCAGGDVKAMAAGDGFFERYLLHSPRKKEFTLEGNPKNSASFRRNR